MRAASLLAKGLSQSEVARRVGAHRQSVSKWAAQLEAKGRAGLKKVGRAGRKPRLSAEQISQIERGLKRGPQALGYQTSLWTANRVVHLIEQECGVRYHPGHVWKILRQLGWSCQRPAGRALERDEKAIERWKRERWPELKKGQKSGPDHSFHRREWTQRAAPSGAHLGAAGTDPGAAIPLQLENPVGDGGGNVVELLLSALSRRHQKSASG
jgi:transposase